MHSFNAHCYLRSDVYFLMLFLYCWFLKYVCHVKHVKSQVTHMLEWW